MDYVFQSKAGFMLKGQALKVTKEINKDKSISVIIQVGHLCDEEKQQTYILSSKEAIQLVKVLNEIISENLQSDKSSTDIQEAEIVQ